MDLARDGLTNHEIAQRIGLAEASVKGALSRLMRRFDCQNRVQLLALVDPQPKWDEPGSD